MVKLLFQNVGGVLRLVMGAGKVLLDTCASLCCSTPETYLKFEICPGAPVDDGQTPCGSLDPTPPIGTVIYARIGPCSDGSAIAGKTVNLGVRCYRNTDPTVYIRYGTPGPGQALIPLPANILTGVPAGGYRCAPTCDACAPIPGLIRGTPCGPYSGLPVYLCADTLRAPCVFYPGRLASRIADGSPPPVGLPFNEDPRNFCFKFEVNTPITPGLDANPQSYYMDGRLIGSPAFSCCECATLGGIGAGCRYSRIDPLGAVRNPCETPEPNDPDYRDQTVECCCPDDLPPGAAVTYLGSGTAQTKDEFGQVQVEYHFDIGGTSVKQADGSWSDGIVLQWYVRFWNGTGWNPYETVTTRMTGNDGDCPPVIGFIPVFSISPPWTRTTGPTGECVATRNTNVVWSETRTCIENRIDATEYIPGVTMGGVPYEAGVVRVTMQKRIGGSFVPEARCRGEGCGDPQSPARASASFDAMVSALNNMLEG